ncbi:MAG: BON domain-containing protein [Nitrospirae bacterium]|nr:BON domain-containing protein [Nitrospirota bacterium]
MKMKAMYYVAMMVAAAVLLVTGMPVCANEMDDRIESSFKKSHVFTTYLKDDDIKIKSEDGAVTLKGTVAEEYHKSLAHDTVASLPGVKNVDNRLEVKGEHPAEMSDAWITAKVKTTLLFHRSVSAMTEVSTKEGNVILRGEADNQAQKDLTTEYVKDIEGVKDVNNEMTVPKTSKMTPTVGETIDDASITAQVKMTLLFHRSTSAVNTKVDTNKGVVMLGGKAKNMAEKDLVTKLVEDVKGVKSVKNMMTVDESK